MTNRIQNLDYEMLDFDYINIHAARMIPSRILKQCYDKRFDSGLSAWDIFLDNIIQSIENRYWLKWERIAKTLFSDYDALKNLVSSTNTNSDKSTLDTSNESEGIFSNKSENRTGIKKSSSEDNSANVSSNESSSNSKYNKKLTSEGSEEDGYYGYNSNIAAPSTNSTNVSGELEKYSSDDTEKNKTASNNTSNSVSNETNLFETGIKDNKSRNLDNERSVKENEVVSNVTKSRTIAAQDLIMKEIELRKETMVSIMFNDVDKILCLSTF